MPAWRYRVINLLREAFKHGALSLPPEMKDSGHELSDFNAFLDEQYQKDWIVHFTKATKSPHRTKTRRHETCEGEEFIERLTQHIPDKGFRMIRYYGFLVSRVCATLIRSETHSLLVSRRQ